MVFRLTLVLYVVVTVAVVVKVLIIGPTDLPESAAMYVNWWAGQAQSDLELLAGWLGLVGILASLVAALAMTFFLRWGRPIFAAAICFAVISEGLLDLPVLKTPLEYFLDTLMAILAGGVIVSSYWSPVSSFFKSPET